MNIDKKLVSQFAGVLAVAMLFGTSAFAEDRHHDETNRGERHERHQRDSGQTHVQSGDVRSGETRSNEFHNNNDRNRQFDNNNQWRGSNEHRDYRNNNNDHRNDYRNNDRSNTYRNNDRSNAYRYNNDHRNDFRNNDRYRGNDGHRGTPYYAHGRISRVERWNNGYRLWIGGALYPFFVPELYFRSHNWRVGIDVNLGGYYNPLGYYDYYDQPYYDGGYSTYSSGALRGVVETVDFRRGTFVLRDDISGNFVTVVMRGRDYDFGRIRPGDYVDVAGDWSRNGLFEAYRADLMDNGYYGR